MTPPGRRPRPAPFALDLERGGTAGLDVDLLQTLLEREAGEPVPIVAAERFEPWAVARVRLSETGVLPPSVIVKWLRTDSSTGRTGQEQMLTERASLEFLGHLPILFAPRLIAADDRSTVLVMEDLSPRRVLWDLLRKQDPAAEEGMAAFASTMGRLHAATAGHEEDYYERRRRLGVVDPQADRRRIIGTSWSWVVPQFAAIGVEPTRGVEGDMAAARETLIANDSFKAFSNGDAGANNFLVTGADGRLIDFESAGYRHPLLDAACLHVPGPMWMTVPDPVPSGTADIYRTDLADGVEWATDDGTYGLALTAACLVVALERLERFPRLDARPPGHESRAQMISTLDAAVRASRHHGALPHLTDWVQQVASTLCRRWPDADRAFPDIYTLREEIPPDG